MNAVVKEDIGNAVRKMFAKQLSDGYGLTAIYEYSLADNSLWGYRVRVDKRDSKIVRPVRWNGCGYEFGEAPAPENGKPLYGLPALLGADKSKTVVVVEGELCVDSMAKRGIVAVTSGACSSAMAADWLALKGRNVLIWRDNDKPGVGYARDVKSRLDKLGVPCEEIDVDKLGLTEKGDCVDFFALHPDADERTIFELPRLAASNSSDELESVGAPEPLRRPVPAPEPYPIAELGPIMAPACESLRRVIQAPDAICGASLLAAASLATQALADVELDGRVCPISLWTLTIAESGQRKSAVDAEAMRAARDHEKKLMNEYREACGAHSFQLEEWNVKREVAKTVSRKDRQGAGLGQALEAIGQEPPAPLRPTLIAADFTAEGLAKMLAVGLPSVGAFTDEAALVFGGHGMQKETTTRTAGTLSKLWDSGTLDRIRASDGATKLYGRRLAMHLMAQPVIAERALSDDVLSGQGFLARCLLAWPESTAGQRTYRAESLRDDAAMVRCSATFAALHDVPIPIADGERNELAPRRLKLTPEASATWRQFHDEVEAAIKPGGRFAMVQAWASKTAEQALRIAGVLTLVERHDASTIDAPTIERAAEIATWHLNEAARLAGTAELSQETRDAEALLDWCHETKRTLLHSRDALRFGPSRIRERERFLRAMDLLEDAGWARKLDGGAKVDGTHRRNVWCIATKSEED